MRNNVDHPSHYQSESGIECIDAIRAAVESQKGIDAFCVGTAIKYLWRNNKKIDYIEDIHKAIWYLDYLLTMREENPRTVSDVYEDLCSISTSPCSKVYAYSGSPVSLDGAADAIADIFDDEDDDVSLDDMPETGVYANDEIAFAVLAEDDDVLSDVLTELVRKALSSKAKPDANADEERHA